MSMPATKGTKDWRGYWPGRARKKRRRRGSRQLMVDRHPAYTHRMQKDTRAILIPARLHQPPQQLRTSSEAEPTLLRMAVSGGLCNRTELDRDEHRICER